MLETGDGYKHSVDFLRDHRVQLIRIFCPEHGFRGDADAGETVVITGIGRPVYRSFPYTERRKPSPADLQGLDVVVFDMQDVGVRFYTYLSTLHYVMEACAENQVPLVVMDRRIECFLCRRACIGNEIPVFCRNASGSCRLWDDYR